MPDKPSYTLRQLADYIGADIVGDSDYRVEGLATLQDAEAQQLTFLSNKQYNKYLADTNAGCVLLKSKDQDGFQGNKLITTDPYLAYAKLSKLFLDSVSGAFKSAIHKTAVIDDDVTLGSEVNVGANVTIESGSKIGSGVHIYPGVYIGRSVTIGDNTILYANVSIYHDVSVGNSCIIHSASVIGADGFGFAPSAEGWEKIQQLGGVTIGHSVEIGASTTVDRGALGNTVIGDGVKIDNQVQIAHNVNIGERTAIAASVAIAGSTHIGKRCTIAGLVGIVGHLTITDDVHITGMTMVSKSISTPGSYSSGIPMNETRQWRKNAARFNQLDAMARQLKSIKK
ncbi:MAG: UDP-3-O-(3-hydroxymyristoyl)glucosamine N-acyltransferase [Cellvibrionaceae bacterium]